MVDVIEKYVQVGSIFRIVVHVLNVSKDYWNQGTFEDYPEWEGVDWQYWVLYQEAIYMFVRQSTKGIVGGGNCMVWVPKAGCEMELGEGMADV